MDITRAKLVTLKGDPLDSGWTPVQVVQQLEPDIDKWSQKLAGSPNYTDGHRLVIVKCISQFLNFDYNSIWNYDSINDTNNIFKGMRWFTQLKDYIKQQISDYHKNSRNNNGNNPEFYNVGTLNDIVDIFGGI